MRLRVALRRAGKTVAVSNSVIVRVRARTVVGAPVSGTSGPPTVAAPAVAPTTPPPTAPAPAAPGASGPSTPIPTTVLELAAIAATVDVGSTEDITLPAPLISVTGLNSGDSPLPDVSASIEDGRLRLSALTTAVPRSATAKLSGVGCTDAGCDQQFSVPLTVTVAPMAAPPGEPGDLTNASPDRVSAAVDHVLQDEVAVVLGTADAPGDRAAADQVADAVDGVVTGGVPETGIYQIRWTTAQDIDARIAQLEALPGVASAAPSTVGLYGADNAFHVADSYDEPKWTWPYAQIDAQGAWAQAPAGSNVTVGIVDVDNVAWHEDIDRIGIVGAATEAAAHATHVAGLACAKDNAVGMVGLGMGCPVLSAATSGFEDLHIATRMTNVVKAGARVVNASIGSTWSGGGCLPSSWYGRMEDSVAASRDLFRRLFTGKVGNDVLWTFSAGNNCAPIASSPWAANGDLPNVITVAATNSDKSLASFSDWGTGVELAAPGGVQIASLSPSILPTGGLVSSSFRSGCGSPCTAYEEMAGTSMAAPIVAGVAALVRSAAPTLSADQVGACITQTAGTDGVGTTTGSGTDPEGWTPPASASNVHLPIVNADAAVRCATGQTSVTPIGSTTGPAGLAFEATSPPCSGIIQVSSGALQYQTTVEDDTNHLALWTSILDMALSPGAHTLDVTCRPQYNGSVLWEHAVDVNLTAARPTTALQSAQVAPGSPAVFLSATPAGPQPCPTVPGRAVNDVQFSIAQKYLPNWAAFGFGPASGSASTFPLTIPPDTPVGTNYYATALCTYARDGVVDNYVDYAPTDLSVG